MPDPTPTPGTLRAAVADVLRLHEPTIDYRCAPCNRPWPCRTSGTLNAALAASPAPTDSPDERPRHMRPHRWAHTCGERTDGTDDPWCNACRWRAVGRLSPSRRRAAVTLPPNHGEWLPDTGTYEDGATEEQRRTEVRATTCRRLGHHWTPGGVCDRCGDARPAAALDGSDGRCLACRATACAALGGDALASRCCDDCTHVRPAPASTATVTIDAVEYDGLLMRASATPEREVVPAVAVQLTDEADWQTVATWCGGTLTNHEQGDSGECETTLTFGDGQTAGLRDWVLLHQDGTWQAVHDLGDVQVREPSPAPTDTPDERAVRGDVNHWVQPVIGWLRLTSSKGESLTPERQHEVVTRLYRALAAADGKPFADQQQVESPDPRPAAVGVCTYDAAPHAMFDDCADWRPAAVTAPREDERAQAAKVIRTWWSRHSYSTDWDWNAQNLAIDLDEAGLLAAAAAVERATPDPDTLAALLAKADGYPPPATAPAHYDQARALIAAGVTLNETAPFEADDTMAAGSKLAASNFRHAEAIFKSTGGPGAKVLPTAHLRGPMSHDPSAVVLWINDECAILRADHLTTIIAALTDARDDVVAHDATRTATTPTQEDA